MPMDNSGGIHASSDNYPRHDEFFDAGGESMPMMELLES